VSSDAQQARFLASEFSARRQRFSIGKKPKFKNEFFIPLSAIHKRLGPINFVQLTFVDNCFTSLALSKHCYPVSQTATGE